MEILNVSDATIIIEEVYVKKTYGGLLVGTPLMATQNILEDVTRIGLPIGWEKYPAVGIGLADFVQDHEKTLPAFSVAAFLVSMRTRTASDCVLVAVWFQDQQFAPPSASVLEEIRNLDWERISVAEQYYG